MDSPLPYQSPSEIKARHYQDTLKVIDSLNQGERDWIAILSTIVCELHNRFEYFHWTGFYRVVAPELLKVGPYQGGHGCLTIPFRRGVCGAAARTGQVQLLEDVNAFVDHIACSSTTISEIVLPVLNRRDQVVAVLDIDSDYVAAFDDIDREYLGQLVEKLRDPAPEF